MTCKNSERLSDFWENTREKFAFEIASTWNSRGLVLPMSPMMIEHMERERRFTINAGRMSVKTRANAMLKEFFDLGETLKEMSEYEREIALYGYLREPEMYLNSQRLLNWKIKNDRI